MDVQEKKGGGGWADVGRFNNTAMTCASSDTDGKGWEEKIEKKEAAIKHAHTVIFHPC